MLLRALLIVGLLYVLWRTSSKVLGPTAQRTLRNPTPKPAAPSPWDVLGIEPGASPEAIKAAYQNKIRQYHPDKVADLGPELRELAETHSKAINDAYAKLKKKGA